MKSLPSFAEEAYVYLLKNSVFFSIEDVSLVYKSKGFTSFVLDSGAEVRVFDNGKVVLWPPGEDSGIVLVEAKKEEVRAGEL